MKTAKDLWETITALADEFPDRRADYIYVADGEPQCIIGMALIRMGADKDTLHEFNHCNLFGIVGTRALDILKYDNEYYLTREFKMASKVQFYQDSGDTWRQAVDSVIDAITGERLKPTS